MTMLFEALTPEAQNELVRDHVIDLVTVVVRAVPDPGRPDDRLAMTLATEVKDAFAPGQPGIDAEFARVQEICASAGEDLSVNMQDALLVALNRRRKDLDGLRAGTIGGHPVSYLKDPQVMEFLGPVLKAAKPEVTVWCLTWTIAMDDDGKLLIDCEDSFSTPDSATAVVNLYNGSIFTEDWDHETREKAKQRMLKVNDVVGRVTRSLMGGNN
jgi:hypothetical protein